QNGGLLPKTAWDRMDPGGVSQDLRPGLWLGLALGVNQGHSAGQTDQLSSILAGSELDEGLDSVGLLHGVVGDEVEGTLDLISTIQNGGLAALNAADGQGLDGVAHSGQGSVADGQRVGSHSG